jgi:hypothetical protein
MGMLPVRAENSPFSRNTSNKGVGARTFNPIRCSAVASSISCGGALLSGLAWQLRPGDLIWIEYNNRKARFRIVWFSGPKSTHNTQAAVQKLQNEECPWIALLSRRDSQGSEEVKKECQTTTWSGEVADSV